MAMTPMAARMHDKVGFDSQAFRDWTVEYVMQQTSNGCIWSGSAVGSFWQESRNRLKILIASNFDWIEREARMIEPSSLRRQSIEQCVGATATLASSVRRSAVAMNARMAKSETLIDQGNWAGIDENAIWLRGERLLDGMGLSKRAPITIRLNNLVKDNPWFSVIAIILAVISLTWNIWDSFHQ
jgi:hypothetical protein